MSETTTWQDGDAGVVFRRAMPDTYECMSAEYANALEARAAALDEMTTTDRGRKRLWSIKHLHALEKELQRKKAAWEELRVFIASQADDWRHTEGYQRAMKEVLASIDSRLAGTGGES